MIATYRIHIRIPRQILFPMSFHMKKWKRSSKSATS